jgi:hypothetical protein
MTDQQTGSDQPVERGAAEEASGAPLTPTEVDAARRPPSDPGRSVTADDGSGTAGGSSGGSGGGSSMPGHPDAAGR